MVLDDLVTQARGGDRSALDSLLREQHDRVYALCRRMMGNDADALDACQEALIAIVRGLARFDGRSAFATWVYRVATNACLDELRRRRRRPELGLDAASIGVATSDTQQAVADRFEIDEALATLPADYRAAVVLRDLCDLSYAEIADVLDIPAGTVRSRIARGRTALAPVLAPDAGNPAPPHRRQRT
jgi:RNA polymerase sigma-70 factor, ECF subfamily